MQSEWNPHYGLVSYAFRRGDLFKLDQLVFELRRRTIGLDWIVGEDWKDDSFASFSGQAWRDVLRALPERQIRKIKLPTGEFNTIGSELKDVWFAWNFSFGSNSVDLNRPAPVDVAPDIPGFGNSYLSLLFGAIQEGRTDKDKMEIYVGWLLENIRLGKEIDKSFRKALSKHGL
ncbi:MAG: hypothetical protein ABJQ70_14850 [Roseobacter sp.]